MKKYKGYYIDNVIFHSEAEIDAFIKNKAIEAYIKAVQIFASHSTMENSIYCTEKAEILVEKYGYTWDEIEALEIQTLEAVA